MNTKDLIWQTRNEMPVPTNPLQELREILTGTSRDTSEDKMIACLYGIIVGWDDAAYGELKAKHGWSNDVVNFQKGWHENYKKAWNLWMEAQSQPEPVEQPESANCALYGSVAAKDFIIGDDLKTNLERKPAPVEPVEEEEKINEIDYTKDLHDLMAQLSFGGFLDNVINVKDATERIDRFIKSKITPKETVEGEVKKQIEDAARLERIYEPKYGGKDHSGYENLMKYEVNDEREECFEKGAYFGLQLAKQTKPQQ